MLAQTTESAPCPVDLVQPAGIVERTTALRRAESGLGRASLPMNVSEGVGDSVGPCTHRSRAVNRERCYKKIHEAKEYFIYP
jgi:hypothetical protein